jgi:hypothetical protein
VRQAQSRTLVAKLRDWLEMQLARVPATAQRPRPSRHASSTPTTSWLATRTRPCAGSWKHSRDKFAIMLDAIARAIAFAIEPPLESIWARSISIRPTTQG